jgi:RNase H-fold protein (predicted Holliday junction resolvase)
MTVLGVSLGSRVTGIAIVKNRELLVSRSLTLRNRNTTIHTATLDNYIRQYRVAIVVIKIPPVTHLTERLKELLRQCIELFQYRGCIVEYKETKAIKARLPDVRNKWDVIKFTSNTYPGLAQFERRELAGRQKYHVKMFEAVIIAHIQSLDMTSLK